MTKLKVIFILFFLAFILYGCDVSTSEVEFIPDSSLSNTIEAGAALPDFTNYVDLYVNNEIIDYPNYIFRIDEASTSVLGTFEVLYQYNFNNRLFEHTITFTVVDTTAPTLVSAVNEIVIEYGDSFPNLVSIISASDNYDQQIQITSNMIDYSNVDLDRVGNYQITYIVSDSSNNISEKNIPVRIVDTVSPVVTSQTTLVTTEKHSAITDLSQYVLAFDNYDGLITITLDMIDLGDLDYSLTGTYEITYYIYDSSFNTSEYKLTIEVTDSSVINFFTLDYYETITSISDFEGSLAKTGSPKLLVLPIDFSSRPGTMTELQNLRKAFFGTSDDTGWESVASYYYKSSYGNLNLTGEVLNWYRAKNTPYYYESRYNDDGDYLLIKEALTYHAQYQDLSIYDSDGDGYIDALYIIYSVDYSEDSDLWWAYQYWYDGEEKYDGLEAYYYVFASLDFINEGSIGINAKTFIHETGHMLGLDDYYDYNYRVGPKGGLGGADMMDNTVGDHASISKLLLGWINPYVVTGDVTLTISSFSDSGDAIIISPFWNDTIFDEYYIIDFYTPTGLNEQDKIFTISGIRIYHINAKIGTGGYGGEYPSYFQYDNSDTTYKFVKLIEADGYNDIEKDYLAEDSDLFLENDSTQLSLYGKSVFASITVTNIDDVATVYINFTN